MAYICEKILLALQYIHNFGSIYNGLRCEQVIIAKGGKVQLSISFLFGPKLNLFKERPTFCKMVLGRQERELSASWMVQSDIRKIDDIRLRR